MKNSTNAGAATRAVMEIRAVTKLLAQLEGSLQRHEGEPGEDIIDLGYLITVEELRTIVNALRAALPEVRAPEADYPSLWLMRHEDGREWETSGKYTSAEITDSTRWLAKPVRRINESK